MTKGWKLSILYVLVLQLRQCSSSGLFNGGLQVSCLMNFTSVFTGVSWQPNKEVLHLYYLCFVFNHSLKTGRAGDPLCVKHLLSLIGI
jgi:hypothetical protein